MKMVSVVCVGFAALCLSTPTVAKPLDKASVLQLTGMGLGDDAVVAKIQSDKVDFDVSTDDMVAFKKQGLSSPVIAALITNRYVARVESSLVSPDPAVPHPAGFYALQTDGDPRMQRMEPTVTNQAKTGGILGYALTGGIASMSVKAAVQNETSKVPVSAQPRFYFFSAESNGDQAGAWASGTNTTVSSPAELTLVRLTAKSGRREARVGSMNIGGAKTGVMDKDRIAFNHTQVRPGVFVVEPVAALPAGEYGFIYSLAGGGAGGAMTARIFDFTVR
ncbi:hypothetical protein ASE49_06595 [Novosphingobium sp. Leaf2]|nr:hypothetical protein ASE49_06595 [Novosphingobium sp. Leaf2]